MCHSPGIDAALQGTRLKKKKDNFKYWYRWGECKSSSDCITNSFIIQGENNRFICWQHIILILDYLLRPVFLHSSLVLPFKNICLLILDREEGERKRVTLIVVTLIYEFIGWFLYVLWPGLKPANLVYLDKALTNWTTWQG